MYVADPFYVEQKQDHGHTWNSLGMYRSVLCGEKARPWTHRDQTAVLSAQKKLPFGHAARRGREEQLAEESPKLWKSPGRNGQAVEELEVPVRVRIR